jgi:hypothetical protein
MRRLVRGLLDQVGIDRPLPDLPDGVEAVVRRGPHDRYLFLLNYRDCGVAVRTPADAVPLIGDPKALAANDVALLRLPAHPPVQEGDR